MLIASGRYLHVIMSRMRPFKIIFVHGYTASHLADWYPNISKKLDVLGVDYAIPDLPGGEHPHAKEWLETLHKEILKTTKPLVLVGHSLGTRAVLLYLEKYQPHVEAVFLVSAFANRLENGHRHNGESYPDFFDHVLNLERTKSQVGKFVVLHATDDTSEEPTSGIDYQQGVEIAGELGATLYSPKKRGHFDGPENADYILDVLRKELEF